MSLTLAVAKLGLRLIYLPLKLFPTQNKVVMMSRESDGEPIDYILLREKLAELSPETRVVSYCRKQTKSTNPITYSLFLLRSLYHIATARVAVTDTYSVPLCVLHHKKSLTIVQIWHALGAIKQFSYQCLDKEGGHSTQMARQMAMHRNYDYILCTSEATRRLYAKGFDAPIERILPLGMPRVDYIRRPDPGIRERYLKKHPQLRGKRLMLYLPTFREGLDQGVEKLVAAAAAWKQQVALLVKPHPLSRFPLPEENRTEPGWSTYDLMKVCDGVITDYSASSLETALLRKPVYFYLFDKQEYQRTQGLNIDPEEELPKACCAKAGELMERIAQENYDFEALDRFLYKYVETAGEDNTRRITEWLCRFLPPAGDEQGQMLQK